MKVLSLILNVVLLGLLVVSVGRLVSHEHETILEIADPEGFRLAPSSGYSLSPGFLTSGGTNFTSLVNASSTFGIGTSSPAAKLSIFTESGLPSFMVGSTSLLALMDSYGHFSIGATTSSHSLFSLSPSSQRNDNLLLVSTSSPSNATGTALVMLSSGRLGLATTSPSQELGLIGDAFISSSATTTLFLDTNGASAGSCIQMRGATSSIVYRIYISEGGSSGPGATDGAAGNVALRIERGACQ